MAVQNPVIGMIMGDAAGIGPELIITALENKDIAESALHFVIGSMEVMERAAKAMNRQGSLSPTRVGRGIDLWRGRNRRAEL